MSELRCTSTSRQMVTDAKLAEYEEACTVRTFLAIAIHGLDEYTQLVSTDEGKDFNFPKQHWAGHITSDIKAKGTLDNMSTRPGEGFFQEAKQAYKRTNGKEAEKQVRQTCSDC